jgi:hypothetical protein
MKCAVEIGSGVMIYIPGSAIQKSIVGGYTDSMKIA